MFLERFVPDPRHVEVQILGDTARHVVHLFERECSIQRRYQKIVEECPSPAVDGELRAALAEAAVTAGPGDRLRRRGHGRVRPGPRRAFYFLEVNTRLQVEHPVTEVVTGLDLVELQLRIAEGEPLPPEVREAAITGHAIEARLYAEDVPAGFLPATGTLHRFAIPAGPGVRVDTGFATGRWSARTTTRCWPRSSRTAAPAPTPPGGWPAPCEDAEIHGVTTNRDLLVAILREPEFLAGATDTGYLTRHDPAALGRRSEPRRATAHARAGRGAGPPGGQPRRGARPGYPALGLAQRRLRAAAGQLHRRGGAVRRRLPRPRRHRPGLGQRRAAGPGHRPREPARTASTWKSTGCGGCTGCTGSAPARTSTPATGRAP